MKILMLTSITHVKDGFVHGGAEKTIIKLSNYLAARGHDVILVSICGKDKAYAMLNDNVKFIGYECTKKYKLTIHAKIFCDVLDSIKRVKPDVVISFWLQLIFYMSLNPIFKDIKVIYSERNDPSLEYSMIGRMMRKRVIQYADGIVFQTVWQQNYSLKAESKSIVIHNPVYIKENEYSFNPARDNRIVAVGRLYPQKNHRLLIDAFADISKLYPGLVLEIYGDGPLETSLQAQICSLGLSDKVRLMGGVSNIFDCIYGAGLFVMPSLYEGMPNALMEAMCLGIPVLSSDCPCGGPRELIVNGQNGFLFEVDNKDDLIKKVNEILGHRDLSQICKREMDIVTTHAENKIFGKWERYIFDVVNKRSDCY